MQALRFGVGIRQPGYNLFAIGPHGVGKQTLLKKFLAEQVNPEAPGDWCYVHNFTDPERPRALELPAGMGARLQREMVQAVEELRVGMRAAFDGEEYRSRKRELHNRLHERQERALADLQQHAKQRDVAVVRHDAGVAIAPIRDGKVIDVDAFHELPEAEQKKLQTEMEKVGSALHKLFRTFLDWGREHRDQVQALDREMAASTAHRVLDRVRVSCAELPAVLEHLDRVEEDVIDNADQFLEDESGGLDSAFRRVLKSEQHDGPPFRRYQINVMVDRTDQKAAPMVFEDNPTYANLVGRIEHETRFGTLVTNFTLIKAGAFHRAIGGYLILDARKLLTHPLSWEAVKRTVRAREVKLESLGQALGLVPTVSLDPEPIPLGDTKVIVVGDRLLYYLLAGLDPELPELFKVLVDFEDRMDWDPDSQAAYAGLIATIVSKDELRPFDRSAVARTIEEAARSVGDGEKLSVQMRQVADLLREADFWAGDAGRDTVTAADVQRAVQEQRLRAGRVRDRLQEAVRRQDILVATSGQSVGQVNGLSVLSLGEHLYGQATRITARTRLGHGELIDIEREVTLGGPVHSKGVLILGGYLGARYAPEVPLSLSATLVFEQSYGGVEGDSASLAELCALLSSLADLPIEQSLAVTGSVNQLGQVQSIGGVNQKIEGFFDVCVERGLTGDQGVIIPATNVKNLMLRADVVAAVEEGRFHVHAIDQVDDALSLLTGVDAGARDETGQFPAGSVNARVEARLIGFAERARSFARARHAPIDS